MEIRPLRETDDRTAFRSGDADLDRFLAKYAGQNQFRHHIGTTYVAVDGDRLMGYATVAAGQVEGDAVSAALRRKLPHYPLQVLRLARLAVDTRAQAQGVGKALLRHVLLLALKMSEEVGCVGVIVDAKPGAVEFYSRVGFTALKVSEGHLQSRPEPLPMFLPLELVAAALVPRGR
jgi:predicted N-acetyltransferase YhbS